ncbi:MAG: DUF4230 domain-containing protein [Chloroflexi bacterium]|nr:DUF4230 domain-containing protein [Chloroflexota bacterium]
MSAISGKSGKIGLLNRIVLVFILTLLVILGIAYFISSNGSTRTQVTAPGPITIGQIQKLYRLETAHITGQTIIEGQTSNAIIPALTTTKITYQVILTMTAGIDMSLLKDSDIQSDGETLTIVLPNPQVLSETSDFIPIAESKDIFSGPSEKKELPKMMVDEGKTRVRQSIVEQGELFQQARTNAEDNLRNLITQIAPQYKKIVFVQASSVSPSPSSSPSPKPSGAPR